MDYQDYYSVLGVGKDASEQEIKRAKTDLKRDIAEFSVTAAEALLKEKIGEEDQNKLVNDFMTKVVEAK